MNGDYGSAVSGNILFGTRTIIGAMWTTFTGIPSSMVGSSALWTGHTQVFMPIYDAVFLKRIGVEK